MGKPSKASIALSETGSMRSLRAVMRHLCAEKIGEGVFRDVYVLKQDPRFVVKVERDLSTGMFANATEWRNYVDNHDWAQVGPWLAPCEAINETGQVLIQRRVTHKSLDSYPRKIPSLLSDCKRTNYGFIGKRFVCCDYPFLAHVPFRMKLAKWWDLETEA